MYAIARFTIEFFRADSRGEWFGFSTSQLIALVLLGVGGWILLWGAKQARGMIDDGQNPPTGKPVMETTQRPHEGVTWNGEVVTPAADWPENQHRVLARIEGRNPDDATTFKNDATPSTSNTKEDAESENTPSKDDKED